MRKGLWIVLLLAVICGCKPKENPKNLPAVTTPPIGFVVLPKSKDAYAETWVDFRGWRGEKAILKQEEYYPEGGELITSFFSVGLDGTVERLDYTDWLDGAESPIDPPGLQEGYMLILDHDGKVEYPKIALEIDADPAKLKGMKEAFGNWFSGERKEEFTMMVPAIIRLRLQHSKESKEIILFEAPFEIRPYFSEGHMMTCPPELRGAFLSPSKRTLLIRLLVEGKDKYPLFPIRDE